MAETAFKNFFRIVFYFFKKVVETVLKSGGNCGTYVGGIMDVIKKFVLNIFWIFQCWKLMGDFDTKCWSFSCNSFSLFIVFEQDIHTTQQKY